MQNFIGVLGLCCIAVAWIPQTIKTIRAQRCDLGRPFLILYITGSISLTIYSILNFDPIYLTLNSLATAQSVVNFYYNLFPKQAA